MVMQCQVSEMTWEIEYSSMLELLSVLTGACMECLIFTAASSNTIQSTTSHPLSEKNLMQNLSAKEMVFWEEMDVFMRPLDVVEY